MKDLTRVNPEDSIKPFTVQSTAHLLNELLFHLEFTYDVLTRFIHAIRRFV